MAEWQLPGPANIGRLAELLGRLRRQTVVNALLGSVLGPYLALKKRYQREAKQVYHYSRAEYTQRSDITVAENSGWR